LYLVPQNKQVWEKREKRKVREEISVRWREKVKKKKMFEHMCDLECLIVDPIIIKYLQKYLIS